MTNPRFAGATLSISIIGLVWAGAPQPAAAQNYAQVFASVVNENGIPALNLTANDFEFKMDGQRLPLAAVGLDSTQPKIAIIVDNGDVMYKANANSAIQSGLESFLDTLDPGPEMSLFTVAPNPRRLQDFTASRSELQRSVQNVIAMENEGPRLMDGLFETWDRRFEDNDPWPVFVLVVADGNDNSSYVTRNRYEAFIDELLAQGVTVHAVVMQEGTYGALGERTAQYADNLARNTGGLFLTVNAPSALPESLTQLAEHMNYHTYLISSRYHIVHEIPERIGDVSVDLTPSLTQAGYTLQLFRDRRLPE